MVCDVCNRFKSEDFEYEDTKKLFDVHNYVNFIDDTTLKLK